MNRSVIVSLCAALGAGSMMREASGTSWQPSATPMDAIRGVCGGGPTSTTAFVGVKTR